MAKLTIKIVSSGVTFDIEGVNLWQHTPCQLIEEMISCGYLPEETSCPVDYPNVVIIDIVSKVIDNMNILQSIKRIKNPVYFDRMIVKGNLEQFVFLILLLPIVIFAVGLFLKWILLLVFDFSEPFCYCKGGLVLGHI